MRREPHASTTRVALRSPPALHTQGVSGCACTTKCFRTHTNPPTLPVALTPPCCGGGVDCHAAAAWAVVEHCPAPPPYPPPALVPSSPPSPCGVPRSHLPLSSTTPTDCDTVGRALLPLAFYDAGLRSSARGRLLHFRIRSGCHGPADRRRRSGHRGHTHRKH